MLLLDTHAFVWLVSDQDKLSKRAKKLVQEHPEDLFFSSISALEIAFLERSKRLKLPLASDVFIEKALEHHGIQDLPLNWKVANESGKLPRIHDDPFDRILIATAIANKLSLLTKDEVIPKYPGVKTVW